MGTVPTTPADILARTRRELMRGASLPTIALAMPPATVVGQSPMAHALPLARAANAHLDRELERLAKVNGA